MPASATPTSSFLSRVAQNLPADVFSNFYTSNEQLDLVTVDTGLRKAVLSSMPRASFRCTPSSTLQSLPALIPGLSELVLIFCTDKEFCYVRRQRRLRAHRALQAQHQLPYEQWQREEKEVEEVEAREERRDLDGACDEGSGSHWRGYGVVLPAWPLDAELYLPPLMRLPHLKTLTIIIGESPSACIPPITTCELSTLTSLEVRMERTALDILETLPIHLSCPALKKGVGPGEDKWIILGPVHDKHALRTLLCKPGCAR